MARIRTIKPAFFIHEELFDLEHETGLPVRLAFIGLWCHADRAGRFKWRPRTLKAGILPHDEIDFSRVLDALTTRGFVVKYASAVGEIGWIPTFLDHQIINNREIESDLPEPPVSVVEAWTSTRAPRVPHAMSKLESGREGKGRERKGTGREGTLASPARVKFVPPTIDQVRAYCLERKNSIDPELFHAHYEANGWVQGKAGKPVKNWKAAMVTWEKNGVARPGKPAPPASRVMTADDLANYDPNG